MIEVIGTLAMKDEEEYREKEAEAFSFLLPLVFCLRKLDESKKDKRQRLLWKQTI